MNRRIATWDVMGRWRRAPFTFALGRVELVQFGPIYHALFRPAASDDDLLIWSSGPDAVDGACSGGTQRANRKAQYVTHSPHPHDGSAALPSHG